MPQGISIYLIIIKKFCSNQTYNNSNEFNILRLLLYYSYNILIIFNNMFFIQLTKFKIIK